MTKSMLASLTLMVLTLTLSAPAQDAPATQRDLSGTWLGLLKAGVTDLRLGFQFEKAKPSESEKDSKRAEKDKDKSSSNQPSKEARQTDKKSSQKYIGKMVSIDQNNAVLPLTKITLEGDEIHLTMAFGIATFQGKFNDKNDIAGTYEQSKQKFPLVLNKVEKLPTVLRPQMPKKPYSYPTEDIVFENKKANINLAGTLTMPKGDGPFPAVVLVTGSGPQDRDETLFGHKPFLVIADHLAKNGIACLRYDDRGIGKSGGKFAGSTTEDFASDALAAIRYLKTLKRVDTTRMGICGHSEGGVIAPMVAATAPRDVAFIILLAGTGVSGEMVIKGQVADFSRLLGESEDKIKVGLAFRDVLIGVAKTAKSTEEAKPQMKEAAESFIAKLENETDRKSYKELTGTAVDQLSAPWMRWFLGYDPAKILAKVKCPVLVLNGDKDLQVKPDLNLPPIMEALGQAGNTQVTKVVFKDLNHLFQHCKTGAVSEYGIIEETISPEVLQVMTNWIQQRK